MSDIIQKGKRVFLRYPTRQDRDEFQELRKRSRRFLRRWEPSPQKGVDQYGAAAFTRYYTTARSERMHRLLVCRLEDGAIVGSVGINEVVHGCFQSAYLGYWVGAPFARCGYLSEGVSLAVRYAFKTLRLHRVEANIQPDNAASIALVRRCGFRLEGYSPRYLKIAGRWRDHERWALIREEWKKGGA